MIRVSNIKLSPGESGEKLLPMAAKKLGIEPGKIKKLKIRRRSIDTRRKNDIHLVYTVDIEVYGNEEKTAKRSGGKGIIVSDEVYTPPVCGTVPAERPVVVGFGPGGMFAALVLASAGLKPIVLERGEDVDTRTKKVERFWATGRLDTKSNVQFGEGGAGTFSDGKLNTGINNIRIEYVLREFCDAGAGESILYDARPHVGTDVLKTVVKNIREKIISLGGEVRFNSTVTDIVVLNNSLTAVKVGDEVIKTSGVILAIGHSARDTFEMLCARKVPMEPKPFSMGVRIEHLQRDIDIAQYGEAAELLHPADYKLNCRFPQGDSAYTFCMCPGGYVVAAASEEGRVCTNGMSLSARDGENANSALLVTLTTDMFPDKSILGGMRWQRKIEEDCFAAGGGSYRAPAQLSGDFLSGRVSAGQGRVTPTYKPGVTWCDLNSVLPREITDTLKKAIPELGKKLSGFDSADAVLTAPETRSSSPVRILRDENLMSSVKNLFPCGEGAGYAGGIVSAAVDGIRCAEGYIKSIER